MKSLLNPPTEEELNKLREEYPEESDRGNPWEKLNEILNANAS